MQPRRDSERLNPLQILLLVFVKFGLATPYDLMSLAGMSVGLTSPTLKRLEESGALTCTPGPRKSMRYAITEKGEEQLRRSLESSADFNSLFGEYEKFESAPRAILLAWLYAGFKDALQCVTWVTEKLRAESEKKEREAEGIRQSMIVLEADLFKDEPDFDKGVLIATAYRWMKVKSEAALLSLEVEAIGTTAQLLSQLPSELQIQRADEVSD